MHDLNTLAALQDSGEAWRLTRVGDGGGWARVVSLAIEYEAPDRYETVAAPTVKPGREPKQHRGGWDREGRAVRQWRSM